MLILKPKVLSLLFAITLLVTGFCDLDWQLVSYRFSEWHRTNPLWEYNPYISIDWYIAYMFNVLRLIVGSFMLGWWLKDYVSRTKENHSVS